RPHRRGVPPWPAPAARQFPAGLLAHWARQLGVHHRGESRQARDLDAGGDAPMKLGARKVKGRAALVDALAALGAIAVVRIDNAAKLLPVVEALAAGEVRALELTMTIPGVLATLEALSAAQGDDLLLGAGTVLDAETARLAILAG